MTPDPWFMTVTGKRITPGRLRPHDVCIEDIAHALAMTCRFGGHSRWHYSVAQHSILLADQITALSMPQTRRLYALLHDAHEAYLGDMVRPLKTAERKIRESAVQGVINQHFGLAPSELDHRWIEKYDDELLTIEAIRLMPSTDGWTLAAPSFNCVINPWTPAHAKAEFLATYEALSHGI